jgi:hypothetical protein
MVVIGMVAVGKVVVDSLCCYDVVLVLDSAAGSLWGYAVAQLPGFVRVPWTVAFGSAVLKVAVASRTFAEYG